VDYENKCPILIGVLNGSFLFMADLLKELTIACEIGFIRVSSYKGTESSGEIKQAFGLPDDLENRDVIIVEDIIDTGFTAKYIVDEVKKQNPASIAVCSLLYKPAAMKQKIEEIKYIGFEIPNEFVVGYGLDYDGLGRNLTAIYRAI
jgi:hypoxanthine phosphoribosyltransferase